MPPKKDSVRDLGGIRQNGSKFLVQATIAGRTERGPGRDSREEAETDRDNARLSVSQEEYASYLVMLRASAAEAVPKTPSHSGPDASAASSHRNTLRADVGQQQPQAKARCKVGDKRKHNRGSLHNRGGRKAGPKLPLTQRFQFRSYKISGLDLAMARTAAQMHPWPDAYTVVALMKKLEENDGCLTVQTYHNRGHLLGRLLLQWPTLLHVNRAFRACILYPQRALYSDVDMSASHNHICQYVAQTHGLRLHSLPGYLASKDAKHLELTQQGLTKRDAKQLWLSLLNSGSVKGWRIGLVQKYGGHCVILSKELVAHLKAFRGEIAELRAIALSKEPWASRLQLKLDAGGKAEACRRQLWNTVLTSMESELMRHLETLIGTGVGGQAEVCMPSYDGLLLKHKEGAVDWGVLFGAWGRLCDTRYGYRFPLEVKNFADEVPAWLLHLQNRPEEGVACSAR